MIRPEDADGWKTPTLAEGRRGVMLVKASSISFWRLVKASCRVSRLDLRLLGAGWGEREMS